MSLSVERQTGEGDTSSRKAHEVIRVRPGGRVQSYILSGGWGAVMSTITPSHIRPLVAVTRGSNVTWRAAAAVSSW